MCFRGLVQQETHVIFQSLIPSGFIHGSGPGPARASCAFLRSDPGKHKVLMYGTTSPIHLDLCHLRAAVSVSLSVFLNQMFMKIHGTHSLMCHHRIESWNDPHVLQLQRPFPFPLTVMQSASSPHLSPFSEVFPNSILMLVRDQDHHLLFDE
ncbi:hypothetical protein Tco_0628768 [Tanacetum coccineum]|uniref:Uncharacterized protein n=1 Tax=Tanacetum coccineum TaxID=301880 RepID=A0ABQ4WR94_9ASTR